MFKDFLEANRLYGKECRQSEDSKRLEILRAQGRNAALVLHEMKPSPTQHIVKGRKNPQRRQAYKVGGNPHQKGTLATCA